MNILLFTIKVLELLTHGNPGFSIVKEKSLKDSLLSPEN